jgi:transcriptional regulator with XRE-family HTH domain
MLQRVLERLIPDKDNVPNSLTRGMGKLIRQAREEAGISQAELARLIGRRQASLSNIENGKMEADVSTLIYLAATLRKPLTYFFPSRVRRELATEQLTPELQELLLQAQLLDGDQLNGIMAQVRALAEMHRHKNKMTLDDQNELEGANVPGTFKRK